MWSNNVHPHIVYVRGPQHHFRWSRRPVAEKHFFFLPRSADRRATVLFSSRTAHCLRFVGEGSLQCSHLLYFYPSLRPSARRSVLIWIVHGSDGEMSFAFLPSLSTSRVPTLPAGLSFFLSLMAVLLFFFCLVHKRRHPKRTHSTTPLATPRRVDISTNKLSQPLLEHHYIF